MLLLDLSHRKVRKATNILDAVPRPVARAAAICLSERTLRLFLREPPLKLCRGTNQGGTRQSYCRNHLLQRTMLTNWNFSDESANSTIQQINRQKSARNLQILQFDPSEPRAVFFDPTRSDKSTATLNKCNCRDFNLREQMRERLLSRACISTGLLWNSASSRQSI